MSSIKRIEVIMVLLLCIAVGALAQSGGGVFGRGNTQEQADDFGAMGRGGPIYKGDNRGQSDETGRDDDNTGDERLPALADFCFIDADNDAHVVA